MLLVVVVASAVAVDVVGQIQRQCNLLLNDVATRSNLLLCCLSLLFLLLPLLCLCRGCCLLCQLLLVLQQQHLQRLLLRARLSGWAWQVAIEAGTRAAAGVAAAARAAAAAAQCASRLECGH